MPINRIEKHGDFTVMSNYHLRDVTLSNRACGLLSRILSLPDDWNFSASGLASLSRDGRDAVMSELKELEKAGYLKRRTVRDGSGRRKDRNRAAPSGKGNNQDIDFMERSTTMEPREVLKHVDHTELSPSAKWEDIKRLCDDAVYYQTASICIPPAYVKQAAEYLGDKMPVCTVIGFPHGYNTTAVKAFEIRDAIANGAKEVDMVINIGWAKDGLFDKITDEIRACKEAAGDHILKVIIETGLLTDEEKIALCKCVTDAGADFIKTCTGFAAGKATVEDIQLFKDHIGPKVRMKASSGMTKLEEGATFVEMGCERLGSKLLVLVAKEQGVK